MELTRGDGAFWVNQFIWVKIPELVKLMGYIYSVLLVLGIKRAVIIIQTLEIASSYLTGCITCKWMVVIFFKLWCWFGLYSHHSVRVQTTRPYCNYYWLLEIRIGWKFCLFMPLVLEIYRIFWGRKDEGDSKCSYSVFILRALNESKQLSPNLLFNICAFEICCLIN